MVGATLDNLSASSRFLQEGVKWRRHFGKYQKQTLVYSGSSYGHQIQIIIIMMKQTGISGNQTRALYLAWSITGIETRTKAVS